MNTRRKSFALSACGVALAGLSLLLPTGLVALLEPLDTRAALPVQARLPDAVYDTPLAAALYLQEQAAVENLDMQPACVPLADALALVQPLAEAGAIPALPDTAGWAASVWENGMYELGPAGEAQTSTFNFCTQEGLVTRWNGFAETGRTAAQSLAAYQAYLGLADAAWQTLPGVTRGDSAIAWDAQTCLYCYVHVDSAGNLSLGVQSRTPEQMAQLYPVGGEEEK